MLNCNYLKTKKMKSSHSKILQNKNLIGNIEIKSIFDILIRFFSLMKFKAMLFLITGIPETGKTSSLTTLSTIIGKKIPFIFSNGFFINSFNQTNINIINQLARKSIGIKFYQENFIIKGRLFNLEIKDSKNNLFTENAKLTLKIGDFERIYRISHGLLKKIIKKKFKLGEELVINRTTGDVSSSSNLDIENKSHDKQKTLKNNSFEKILITEQIITLYELDNINRKNNILKSYVSNSNGDSNLDEILLNWSKKNKIKLIKGFLVIDDIYSLDKKNVNLLKNLLLKFNCPIILCAGDSNLHSKSSEQTSLIETLSIKISNLNIFSTFRPNGCKEFLEIIKLKCRQLNILAKRSVICLLVKLALECGLKYSLYLLSISLILKKKNVLKLNDVKQSFQLFLNCKNCLLFTKCQHFKTFYLK